MQKSLSLSQQLKSCPPPPNFAPAGAVRNVQLAGAYPAFLNKKKVKGARAAGIRYERRLQKHLEASYGRYYVPSPWFTFYRAAERRQWCQPDGLLIEPRLGRIIIVECKLRHTSDSWWQTRQLYQPVVSACFGTELWDYSIVEVVRWYDPDTNFPEHYKLVPTIEAVAPNSFGVHIWKDRG